MAIEPLPGDHSPLDLQRLADELGTAADADIERKLRVTVTIALTSTLSLSVLATIVLLFLQGLGHTELDNSVLIALISATVAELAGLLFVVVRFLFPERQG